MATYNKIIKNIYININKIIKHIILSIPFIDKKYPIKIMQSGN